MMQYKNFYIDKNQDGYFVTEDEGVVCFFVGQWRRGYGLRSITDALFFLRDYLKSCGKKDELFEGITV